MRKINRSKLIQDLLVGLIITVLSVAFGYWLNIRHSKPFIEIDSNYEYANIDGMLVGSVFIGNSGYKTDTNISITIDDKIKEKNISIPGLNTNDFSIKDNPQGTTITINSLRPNETVQIFFYPDSKKFEYFSIIKSISDFNNIHEVYYVQWWNVCLEVQVLFIFLVTLFFFLGWYICKRLNDKNK